MFMTSWGVISGVTFTPTVFGSSSSAGSQKSKNFCKDETCGQNAFDMIVTAITISTTLTITYTTIISTFSISTACSLPLCLALILSTYQFSKKKCWWKKPAPPAALNSFPPLQSPTQGQAHVWKRWEWSKCSLKSLGKVCNQFNLKQAATATLLGNNVKSSYLVTWQSPWGCESGWQWQSPNLHQVWLSLF